MSKPTVHDIAREAGVSLATVDRVLNARRGVADKTIGRVKTAVDRLGYVRDTHAANLARKKQYRILVVLPKGVSQFVSSLREALKEVAASSVAERVSLRILEVPSQDPHAIVKELQALNVSKLDGIAIMAPETPQIRDAISHLKEEGLAVVALVSDLPNSQRDYFIGIDNVAAGRTAGFLMGKFLNTAGEILVVTNSLRSRDSLERRLGFDSVMTSDFPTFTSLPTVESYDDRGRIIDAISRIITERPDIVGVYSMGAGNAAVLDGLRQTVRDDGLVVIMHELTPIARQGLMNGEVTAVISQHVGHLVRSAVRVLRSICDQIDIYEAQERIRIDVIVRENLP